MIVIVAVIVAAPVIVDVHVNVTAPVDVVDVRGRVQEQTWTF